MRDIFITSKDYIVGTTRFGLETGLYLGAGAVAMVAGLTPPGRKMAASLEARQQSEHKMRNLAYMAWKVAQYESLMELYVEEDDSMHLEESDQTLYEEVRPSRLSVAESMALQSYIQEIATGSNDSSNKPHQEFIQNEQISVASK